MNARALYFLFISSESSMFVTSKRFILKTCGKTTLLHAVKPLLSLVQQETGMDVVEVNLYKDQSECVSLCSKNLYT